MHAFSNCWQIDIKLGNQVSSVHPLEVCALVKLLSLKKCKVTFNTGK